MTRVPHLRPVDPAVAASHVAEVQREGFGTCLNCGEHIVRAYTSGQNKLLMPFHVAEGGPWTWHRNGRMCRDGDAAHPSAVRYRFHRCDHQEAIADVR